MLWSVLFRLQTVQLAVRRRLRPLERPAPLPSDRAGAIYNELHAAADDDLHHDDQGERIR